MDDLKLYAKSDSQLQEELSIVAQFSQDIGMEFGLEKCAMITIKRGKIAERTNEETEDTDRVQFKELGKDDKYKYLGIEENAEIQQRDMKEKTLREFYHRVRLVLRSELNAKNKMTALNTFAMPTVEYSFAIIDWSLTEVKKMDTKIRKLLTMHSIHHPKSDVARIYISRQEGGRRLVHLESKYKAVITGLAAYLKQSGDRFLQWVLRHEEGKVKYSIPKMATKFLAEVQVEQPDFLQASTPKKVRKTVTQHLATRRVEEWRTKPMHGQFPRLADQDFVDKKATFSWLQSASLKGPTEAFLLAAQDQALRTRYYEARIMRRAVSSRCRLCNKCDEYIDHIIAGCSYLAPTLYLERHNRIASYLHWNILKSMGSDVCDLWYQHQPLTVVETQQGVVLWDMALHTDTRSPANRPDIVVKNFPEKTCLLIDVAVPADANVHKKEVEKKTKYQDLQIEVQRLWSLRTTIIPVVVGALGTVSSNLHGYLQQLPGQPTLAEIQKTALLGTSHILRRTLNVQ